MPNLKGSEWLILILLIVLLFGAKRLPDAARGLGRSLRIFKAETKGLTQDDAPETTTTVQQVPPAAIPAPPSATPATPAAPPAAAPAEPSVPPATAAVPPAEPGTAPER
jgi:sec-independent protein translocase protein TatA